MRVGLIAAVCGLLMLEGCGSGSSLSSPAPQPPVANAGGPYTGAAGAPLSFSGAASSDPQGQLLAYSWNFGDGSTATGANPTHAYATAGAYSVSLTVTDTSGLTGTATGKATILALPVANAGGPYTGAVGTAVNFSGAASSDPQGQALTYTWNFGDGSTGTGASPSHTYAAAGTFTVTLSVTDTSNLTGSALGKATILVPPAANAGGPYNGVAGTAVSFSGATSSDPQGQTLTYAWNFGDNSMGTGASPTHTYAAAGTYNVSLTVTDTSGITGTATSKATIAPVPLPGAGLTGLVYEGTHPLAGAHVYLFAANTTGYGQASVSLVSAAETGTSDSVGAYVLTGSNGGFSLTGDYSCAAGQQLYLYTLGGNAGSGTNAAIGLLAAIGSCPSSTGPAVSAIVNEVTTIAAAYAIAGFATDATHVSSSGTALAQVGVANAFANAANMVTLSTGLALATPPAGNGTVPQGEINTLANILAACAGSSGAVTGPTNATPCYTLFYNAESGGLSGNVPRDTATAAINIAHNPGNAIPNLYGLIMGTPPFAPALSTQPLDFTVMLTYYGAGVGHAWSIAIDGSGDVWMFNGSLVAEYSSSGVPSAGFPAQGMLPFNHNAPYVPLIAIDPFGDPWVLANDGASGGVIELNSSGAQLSPKGGYTGGGLTNSLATLAIDGSRNVWVSNSSTVSKFNSSGVAISPSNGYTTGTSNAGIAVDGSGNIWIAGDGNNSVEKLSNTGTLLSPAGGYTGGGLYYPSCVAVDHSGNVWVLNPLPPGGTPAGLSEFSNSGVALSPSTGFTGGGLGGGGLNLALPACLAIDGAGNVWIANSGGGASEFSNSGAAISPPYIGFAFQKLVNPQALAIDGSGNAWFTNNGTMIDELIGIATPVITPISAGLPATPTSDGTSNLGTRP